MVGYRLFFVVVYIKVYTLFMVGYGLFYCCLNKGLYPIYGRIQTIIRLVQGLLYTWFIRNETTMSPTQIVSDLTIHIFVT